MAAQEPCPRCGAPGSGLICAYCGAPFHEPGDERAELSALVRFHSLATEAGKDKERCSRLINDGYIPSGRKALIEAGFFCFKSIDLSQPYDGCHEQWSRRLETIVSRLRVIGDDEAKRAVAEFEERVKAWKAQDAWDTKMGCTFFAILGLGLIAVFWWLVHKIWG